MRSASPRPVLVAGGAGYVGSHTSKALARAGFLPVAYDNLSRGHRWAVRWGPLIEGDILDTDKLAAVLLEIRPVAVLHFAALAYVAESVAEPRRYWHTNVAGSVSLLTAMARAGLPHLVFSSSCATYGLPQRPLIDEDHPQVPINPYGATKLAVERLIADCAPTQALSYGILRYFNAAGGDPEGETGEFHEPETHLIPLALQAAHGTGPALKVLGTDWPTADGTCVRDYVHVCDLADAHVTALRRLLSGEASFALNLGTGRGHSVREVIAAAETVTGRSVPWEGAPRRPGDPPYLVADAQRAAALLGWRPSRPDLQTMVADAYAWQQRGQTPRALQAAG